MTIMTRTSAVTRSGSANRGLRLFLADYVMHYVPMRRNAVARLKTLVMTLGLLVAAAGPARADGFIVPYWGYNFGGDANCPNFSGCEDKRSNIGVSLGKMGSVFGFEQDFGLSKDFFGTAPNVENSVFTMMSNLLVGVGAGPVQPYVLFGVGLIRPHTSVTLTQIITADKNSLGYDIGGGVTGYFVRHVGIRGDVRRFQTLQDVPLVNSFATGVFANQKLSFWRASLGIAFRF